MKKNLLIKSMLLLCALIVGSGTMWAEETYTIGWGGATGTNGTFSNFKDVSGSVTNLMSFSTAKNASANNPAYNSGSNELRLYYSSDGNGGSITITPILGITITGAVMTTSTTPNVKYAVDGGTATLVKATNNTYTISGISAKSSLTIQNANTSNTQLRIKTITLTYTESSNPVINADDINIEADATSGSITYAILNGTDGAMVSTQVLEGSTITNLAIGTITSTSIPFNCDANTETEEHTATVRLTYNNITKDVTITQAAASAATDDGIFAKYTSAITEGYYVITYDDNALKNTINSNRFENGDFEATNNIITSPDPSVIWYIKPSSDGNHWTIYNDAKAKYAAGTNSNNQGALISDVTDLAKWTITETNGVFEFENYGRSEASNKWLRNNGNIGWGCYGTTVGGSLTLYKLTTLTDRVITFDGNGGSYNEATTYTQNVYDGVEATLDANQFTREGYVFTGWNTVSNGENGTAYTDQATITVAGGDLTLYAQWSQLYTLTIDNNIVGGSIAVEDNVTSAVEGTEISLSFTQTSGHAFNAWNVYKYGDESTKVTVTDNKFTMPAYNVVVSASFKEVQTYSLVTNVNQIVSGKHYIIASGTDGSVKAMGKQNDNNREAVAVNASNGIIPETAGVYEFAIYGPDANGYYSIYDETSGKEGYLYAASSSSNYLRTQKTNNSNGTWKIDIAETTSVATIKAQGSSTRNWIRNNGNLFSCYNSGQNNIYLFEKEGEATPTANVTFASSGYASYCSTYALDLTPAEDYAAYAVTATNGTAVTFTKITGAVLPKTPFILYGKDMSGQTASLPIANGETTDVENNKLVGTLVPTAITTVEGDYTNFGLSGGEFKKIKSGTIPANKAYLPVLTSSLNSEARLTILFDDGTTGVNDVRGKMNEVGDSIFDLQGRKVSKPTKGLYIMNGKKVFVK